MALPWMSSWHAAHTSSPISGLVTAVFVMRCEQLASDLSLLLHSPTCSGTPQPSNIYKVAADLQTHISF